MLSQRATELLEVYKLPLYLAVALGVGLLLGVAGLWFSPLWVLAGVLVIPFLAGIAVRPELGLLAIVVITGGLVDFERLPLLSVGPISFHITDLILLYLVVLVFAKAMLSPTFKVVRTPLDLPLIWFYFAVLLSAGLAIFLSSLEMNYVLRLVRTLTYYLGFFCVTNLIRDRRQLGVLIGGLFLIAVLASLAVLIQALIPSFHLVRTETIGLVTAGREFDDVIRTYMRADRLIYPMLLVSVCSLALGGRWLPPALEFTRASMLSVGLFLSFQRNYWATMMSMLALLGLLVPRAQRLRFVRWAIVGTVTVALLLGLSGGLSNRYVAAALDRLIRGMHPATLARDDSTQMRIMEIDHAIQTIRQHPLLGIGLGNLYRPRVAGDAYWNPEDPNLGLRWYVHNAYLWVWIDMGLVGLIPFIWLYASFLARGFTHWRRISDPRLQTVVLGSTLAVLGQAIGNFVAPNFVQHWSLIVFAIILGINELIYRWEGSEQSR